MSPNCAVDRGATIKARLPPDRKSGVYFCLNNKKPITMSWDTHTHVFDPESFPFSKSRTYTPQAAPLADMIQASPAGNFLLVQASIEDGCQGVLQALRTGRQQYPSRKFRASIMWDPSDAALDDSKEALQMLHNQGVRCLRIHGIFGDGDHGVGKIITHLKNLFDTVLSHTGWAVELQLPLAHWADPVLADFLASDEARTFTVIADHCASVNVRAENPAATNPHFAAFRELLDRCQGLYVKISALHRRCAFTVEELEYVVRSLAQCEDRILFGSDWPHCNSAARGHKPAPPLQVDMAHEGALIRSWISHTAWEKMMVTSPERLFGL